MRDGAEGVSAVVAQPEWQGIPYLVGDTLPVARSYGAFVVPDIFVLDQKRIVRYRGAPDESSFEPERRAQWLRDAIHAVLDGREPEYVPDTLVGCPIKFKLSAR